jgi:hypothetical protein
MRRVPVIALSSNLTTSIVGAVLPSGHVMPSRLAVVNCHRPSTRFASPLVRPVDPDKPARG